MKSLVQTRGGLFASIVGDSRGRWAGRSIGHLRYRSCHIAVVLLLLLSPTALASTGRPVAPLVPLDGTPVLGAPVPHAFPTALGATPPSSLDAPTQTAWPTFLGSVGRTSANLAEEVLSPAAVTQLSLRWSLNLSQVTYTSMAYSNGQLYFGASDGKEYDVNASTGQLVWKTTLGTQSLCYYGVYSSPTVWNGTVYTGGPDNYWYALNASNGSIEWRIQVEPSGVNVYNWASPLVFRGALYIGIASCMDNPLIQGKLLQVNLSGSHSVLHTFDTVGSSSTGASVWATPAADPERNVIWIATGNGGSVYSDALVALNATTLAVVGYWHIPFNTVGDNDFGATPILLNDSDGRPLIVDTNKNGIAYALDRSNVSTNASWRPVWQLTTNGFLSDASFDGQDLYLVGTGSTGSAQILSVNPRDGSVIWHASTNATGTYTGGPVYAHGVLVDLYSSTLDLRRASDGHLIRSFDLGASSVGATPGPPILVAGQVFAAAGMQIVDFGTPLNASIGVNSTLQEGSGSFAVVSNVTGGAPPYSVDWNFGDGSQATGSQLTHDYLGTGTFSIVATIRDAFGASLVRNTSVTVLPALTANISGGPFESERLPFVTSFTATTYGGLGPPYALNWSFGDGSPNSTTVVATHTYDTPGRYNLTLEVRDSLGGFVQVGRVVLVYAPLAVQTVVLPSEGDAPLTVGFSAILSGGAGPYTGSWTFGDGSPSMSGTSSNHTYVLPGTFTATGWVQDSLGATVTVQSSVFVAPAMTASIDVSVPTQNCPTYPLTYEFYAAVGGGIPAFNYSWQLDGGAPTPGGQSIGYGVPRSGNHTVYLTASDSFGGVANGTARFAAPEACSMQPPPSGPGSSAQMLGGSLLPWALAGGLVVAVAVLAVIVWARRRRGRPGNPG